MYKTRAPYMIITLPAPVEKHVPSDVGQAEHPVVDVDHCTRSVEADVVCKHVPPADSLKEATRLLAFSVAMRCTE
jgi:hypothetical protein